MSAFISAQRASSENITKKKFEYIEENPIPSSQSSESDLIFIVGRNQFRGHQHVFSQLSLEIQNCLRSAKSGLTGFSPFNHGGILRFTRCKESGIARITVDASVDVFEAVFNYCYTSRLAVSVELVPAVYSLSKNLQIEALQCACALYLARNLSMDSIGVLSRIVQFSMLSQNPCYENSTALKGEVALADALYEYLIHNADAVASSQTGQLSARLIVNLSGEIVPKDLTSPTEFSYEQIAFGVLCWAYERLLTGERLAKAGNDDNVQSDDEESDGSIQAPSVPSEGGPKRKRAGSQFQFLARINVAESSRQKFTSSTVNIGLSDEEDVELQNEIEARVANPPQPTALYQLGTQDLRISLDINDLPLDADKENSMISPTDPNASSTTHGHDFIKSEKFNLLKFCRPATSPESETCLLASTKLGVGSTTIWIGKLAGHLVSLSIKHSHRTKSGQSNDFNPNSSVLETDLHLNPKSISNGSSNSSSFKHDSGLKTNGNLHVAVANLESDDEVCSTITPDGAPKLARAAAAAFSPSSNCLDDMNSPKSNGTSILMSHLARCPSLSDIWSPLKMLEARSSFGTALLSYGPTRVAALALGGYNRKNCLDSVEIYVPPDNMTDKDQISEIDRNATMYSPFCRPIPGPRMSTLRGRLCVASSSTGNGSSMFDLLYACGGSTGSKDLASVERLTSDALQLWLSTRTSPPTSAQTSGTSSQVCSRRNSDIARLSDFSTSPRCSASSSVWQPLASMHRPRSSPTATDLSRLHCGSVISNSKGSILVAGGLSDAVYLNSTEAYIPERDEWILLPDMLEGRSEASSSVLDTRNLIVVAGGVARGSHTPESVVVVEALDPRCDNWIALPKPLLNGACQLRSACLTVCPTNKEQLLLIGGYNGSETLGLTWIFDPVAWRWMMGPLLSIPRANSSAITLPNLGGTLVFGGYNPSNSSGAFLDTIELIF